MITPTNALLSATLNLPLAAEKAADYGTAAPVPKGAALDRVRRGPGAYGWSSNSA